MTSEPEWQRPEDTHIIIHVDKWNELVRLVAKLGASLHNASQDSRDKYNRVMSYMVDIEE